MLYDSFSNNEIEGQEEIRHDRVVQSSPAKRGETMDFVSKKTTPAKKKWGSSQHQLLKCNKRIERARTSISAKFSTEFAMHAVSAAIKAVAKLGVFNPT